jgi:acetylornithine/succinyldiaminopimelate/putrescine aminotransferase
MTNPTPTSDVSSADVTQADASTVKVSIPSDTAQSSNRTTSSPPTSGDVASEKSNNTLPIRTDDVLAGLSPERVIKLEQTHGNGDLIRVLTALGIAGPLRVLDPWQLEDTSTGQHLIHAGGYAALPFGESYPPLLNFVRAFLDNWRGQSLPQQAVSGWRAALEANLVSLLAREAPSHADSQVFFSNSGAEAVEAALKFARATRPNARVLINFTRAYHGKTLGALSLTPNEEYQAPFRPLLGDVVTLPYGDIFALKNALQQHKPSCINAIIIEPIQGEGGVIRPPGGYLRELGELARKHGITVIADEIQTGLGRSGHYFASLAGGLEPDIITLAKPLGGGLLAVGATIARKRIVQHALGGLASKRHSNTFGGGALAMAVGLKSLELVVEHDLATRAQQFGERGLNQLQTLQQRYPDVLTDVRTAGMLFALQLAPIVPPKLLGQHAELAAQLGSALALQSFHKAGIHACYTLNSSSTLRFTPALNMPEQLFDELFKRADQALASHPKSWQMIPKAPLKTLLSLARLALK